MCSSCMMPDVVFVKIIKFYVRRKPVHSLLSILSLIYSRRLEVRLTITGLPVSMQVLRPIARNSS
jgi:hypothetical protein